MMNVHKPEKMAFLSIALLLKDYAKIASFYIFTHCCSQCLYQDNDPSLANSQPVTGKQPCQKNSFYYQLALMERHKISTWTVGTLNGVQNYRS